MNRSEIDALIEEEAVKVGVRPELLKAIVYKGENSSAKGNNIPEDLISPVGASGIAQIMPKTFSGLQKTGKIAAGANIFDPATNIKAAALVLKEGIDMHGSEAAGVAHYNGGNAAGRAVAAGKEPPAQETRDYLKRTGMSEGGRGTDVAAYSELLPPGYLDSVTGSNAPTKTSTSTTLRTKIPGIDIAGPTEAFVESNRQLRDLLRASTGDTSKLGTQSDSVLVASDATLAAGSAEADAIRARGSIEASRVQGSIDVQSFYGEMPGEDAKFVEAQRQRILARDTKDQLRGRIMDESNVTIFDDPLRWAINQFTLPTLKRTYNAANQTELAKTKEMEQDFALIRAKQAIDPAVSVAQVQAKVNAEAQAKSFEAARNAAAVRNQGLSHIAQTIMSEAQLAGSELAAYQAMARLTGETMGITANNKQEAALLPIIDVVNLQRKSLGLREITIEQFKSMTASRRSELTDLSLLAPGTFGRNIGDTYRNLEREGAIQLLPETNPAMNKTLAEMFRSSEFTSNLEKVKRDAKTMSLPREEQNALALEAAESDMRTTRQAAAKYDRLPDSDPYKLKIGTALQYPELKANSFIPDIQVLLAAKGYQGALEPKDVELTALAKMMDDPSKAASVAKDLAAFWRTAQTQQWIYSGANKLALPRPSEFRTSTMIINGKPVNQWNPTEIEHWLTVTHAKQAAFQVYMDSRGPGVNPMELR